LDECVQSSLHPLALDLFPFSLGLCQPTTDQKPLEKSHLKMEVPTENWRTSTRELFLTKLQKKNKFSSFSGNIRENSVACEL